MSEQAVTRQDEGPDNRAPRGKSYASRVDEMLDKARSGYRRVSPREAARIWAGGGLLVDTRPVAQRVEFGEIPGAISIERNVLEWRLDPTSPDRHDQVGGPDQDIVLFCQAGYASSLAVASLRQLGLSRVTRPSGWLRGMARHRTTHDVDYETAAVEARWARRGGLVNHAVDSRGNEPLLPPSVA